MKTTSSSREIDQYQDIIYWLSMLDFLNFKDKKKLKKIKRQLEHIEYSETYIESRLKKYRRVYP